MADLAVLFPEQTREYPRIRSCTILTKYQSLTLSHFLALNPFLLLGPGTRFRICVCMSPIRGLQVKVVGVEVYLSPRLQDQLIFPYFTNEELAHSMVHSCAL